nr:G-type lectin S-receptor-like serine/threonine-protein kinase At4g27290 [Tanacetum cinerariifolium]
GSLNAHESQREAIELPLFSFFTIANATANFSPANKLGEGGFGSGMLDKGQEIAVKRLSKISSQGVDEFKNEVICISKLQHQNLVKLLGCSIEGDEKLLIYEYMPNRSLDEFIFDKTRSTLLDWTKRLNIIKGIARGLLYLHQDSRLRIIHRDLKASNILVDLDMNPKISDFGIARSFGGDETQANTEKVVGTYGYMSPEYALDGLFSTKSDVFSFGVLVLEIVSGKRNRGFVHTEHNNNLIGHAWRMHNEGKSMELIDTTLAESSDPSEVLRSIEVGLLCVQQSPEDMPNMSSVVLVLGNEGALPKPKQPAFFTEKSLLVMAGSDPLLHIEKLLFHIASAAHTILPKEGAIEGHLHETGLTFQLQPKMSTLLSQHIETSLVEAFQLLGYYNGQRH